MDTKYQIFVSSTFDDLKEERRKVIEQILHLGHIPVGMELFQAGDESQWDLIKRRILECDYYIVIVAERYGAEGPGKKSYTRMEYEFALKSKVPTIAFLLHKDARKNWPAEKTEFEHKDKVQDFRSLCQKKIVQFWHNGDDLAAKVVTSLTQLMRDKPRIGWIRADKAANAEVLNEMAKLSEEKRNLQSRVNILEHSQQLTTSPLVVYVADILSKQYVREFISISPDLSNYVPVDNQLSLLDLFMYLSRVFALSVNNSTIDRSICKFLKIDGYSRIDFQPALAEYLAKDLLQIAHLTDHIFDKPRNEKRYSLTEKGKSLVLHREMQLRNEGLIPNVLSNED